MTTRRDALIAAATLPLLAAFAGSAEENIQFFAVPAADLKYPTVINPLKPYGSKPPDQAQITRAANVLNAAPKGPKPFDVASYFVSSAVPPDLVQQWPSNEAWNPVIVRFFEATDYKASSDMVPWCAAFVNWCLVRSQRKSSGKPSSQSFLDTTQFQQTNSPVIGDLVVFTCHRVTDQTPIGLGHVGFLASVPSDERMLVLGGNQSRPGTSSQISKEWFPANSAAFDRCLSRDTNGRCKGSVRVTLRVSAFVHLI